MFMLFTEDERPKRTTTRVLNINQKVPENVIYLKVDKKQELARQVGRERTYICQNATTQVLHHKTSKLVNESLVSGLKW